MTGSRSTAELTLLALALSVVSLAYASGAFMMGLAFHPADGHGWRAVETIAVGAYATGWLLLLLGAGELWDRWRRWRRKKAR